MGEVDDILFAEILFSAEGGVELTWEVASAAATTADSRQPVWDSAAPYGVTFAAPVNVRGLFRDQDRWISPRVEGEFHHGEVQLTTPAIPINVVSTTGATVGTNITLPACKPNFTDRRVRDRFTVVKAQDVPAGTVFYPVAAPRPFIFDGTLFAWRVQVQLADQVQRTVRQ